METSSVLEIDLSAIGHNMRLMRQIVGPNTLICPIVKADAYGLGAARTARTLVAAGADMLAVYTPAQATELINKAINTPILVLMPVRDVERTDELYRAMICGRLHLTLHDLGHLETLRQLAERYGTTIPLHVELDTGMGRGGCLPAEAAAILLAIHQHPRLRLAGLFTHFARPEDDVAYTDRQLDVLNDLIEANRAMIPDDCLIHAASTYAALRAARYHKSMVRPGLAWAGYGMEALTGGEVIREGEQLRPIVTWRSHIVQIRRVPARTRVGYGSTWSTRRKSVLGLVPVGYADGYPYGAGRSRSRSDGAEVAVLMQGADGPVRHYAPVVGAVNMDQITVDLTDLDTASIDAGTPVELISPDPDAPNHLPRLAEFAGTFTHEMMCRLSPRLSRQFVVKPSAREAAAPRETPEKITASGQ